MNVRSLFATLAAAAVVSLGMSSPADAAFKLRLSDGTTTVTVQDGDANDGSALEGVIVFNGAIGDFFVNVATGISKPVFPASTPKMDLNSVNVSGAAGTLTIELTDTGFSGAPVPLLFSVGGTSGGSVAFTAGGGSSNDEFDLTNSANLSFSGGAFSGTTTAPASASVNPFSMTIKAVITHGGGVNSTSFDGELKAVPAPAGVLLLAAGLPCLAAGYIRRRKAAPVG